jgi:hypothetical protein
MESTEIVIKNENRRVIECWCGAEMILSDGYLSCPVYLDGKDEHDSYEVEIIGREDGNDKSRR